MQTPAQNSQILEPKKSELTNTEKVIRTFSFGDPTISKPDEHEIGNYNCEIGWCGTDGYPKKCSCGGLIHAEFGDDNWDGDYWLYTKCDRCGESE